MEMKAHLARLPSELQTYIENKRLSDISSFQFGSSGTKQMITDSTSILLDCIEHGLKEEKHELVIRIMDLVYRGDANLVDVNRFGQILVQLEKNAGLELPVHLIVMKAKYQHDIGDLHGARRQLVVLLELAIHDCALDEREKTSVKAVCHQLLGQTFNKLSVREQNNDRFRFFEGPKLKTERKSWLQYFIDAERQLFKYALPTVLQSVLGHPHNFYPGCWKNAISPLKIGAELFQELLNEKSNASQCIDLMCRCLTKIQMDEFEELKSDLKFNGCHPCHEAYMLSKRAWTDDENIWSLRHRNNGAEAMLMFVVARTGDSPCQKLLSLVLHDIKASLYLFKKFNVNDEPLLKEFCYEFAKVLFTAALTLHLSVDIHNKELARIFEHRSMVVYDIYSSLTDGHFSVNRKLMNTLMKFKDAATRDLELGLENNSADVSIKQNSRRICNEKLQLFNVETGMKTSEGGYGSHHCKYPRGYPENINPRVTTTRKSDMTKHTHPAILKDDEEFWEVGLVVKRESTYDIPGLSIPVELFQRTLGVTPSTETTQGLKRDKEGDYECFFASCNVDESHLSHQSTNSIFVQHPKVDTGLATRDLTLLDQDRLAQEYHNLSMENALDDHPLQYPPVTDGEWELTNSRIKRARLFKYNPVRGLWFVQRTIAYIGPDLILEESKKGNCRDAFEVKFLHQDEPSGRYVGKRYRKQRPIAQYMRDVVCQKVARFLVTLFNFQLKHFTPNVQIQYLPVAHLQLLSSDSESNVVDWINVEPYLEGEFTKLTNNLEYCSKKGKDIATALTHFTYQASNEKLMLVDIQGWLPNSKCGVIYLTDPQFHTHGMSQLSSCDHGKKGMDTFWEKVHPQCNNICSVLGLTRKANYM